MEQPLEPRSIDSSAAPSLLARIVESPLILGETRTHTVRRHSHGSAETPTWRRWWDGTIVFALCVACGFGVAVSVSDLLAARSLGESTRSALTERIAQQRKINSELQSSIDELNGELAMLSIPGKAGGIDDTAERRGAQRDALRGPGISVTLNERAEARDSDRVRDTDLRMVINALWSAGAEGISLNGTRLSPSTTVRAAGGAILVDLHAVSPPYTIHAIGASEQLRVALRSGSTGSYFAALESAYGITLRTANLSAVELPPAPMHPTYLTSKHEEGNT